MPRAARFLSHLSWPGAPRTVTHGLDVFDLQHGGEDLKHPQRNRPPQLVHLVLYAGNVNVGFPFAYPGPNDVARPLRDGPLLRRRTGPLFFGRVRWAGRSGTLVLAPPYPRGGEQGNHLIFRWRQRGVDYALGLHAWEPLRQTAATLKAIVASIP